MTSILFVDDDPYILDALRRSLAQYAPPSWSLHFVESGIKAIGHMDRYPTDLVVTDLCMPGIGGDRLLSIIADRFRGTKTLLMSGRCTTNQAMKIVGDHDRFVAKPINHKELVRRIDRQLATPTFDGKFVDLVGAIGSFLGMALGFTIPLLIAVYVFYASLGLK